MPMLCVASLEMNEGNSMGQGYNRPIGCSAEKAPHATFNFFNHLQDDRTVLYRCAIQSVVLSTHTVSNQCLSSATYNIIS